MSTAIAMKTAIRATKHPLKNRRKITEDNFLSINIQRSIKQESDQLLPNFAFALAIQLLLASPAMASHFSTATL